MAIKTQSQLLLLALFPEESRLDSVISFERVSWLFPRLTAQGLRSLVQYLQSKGMLLYERVGQQAQLYLSEHGQISLHTLFPVLDPSRKNWAGNWSCIVFCDAPVGDKQFRYLRRVLVELKAVQLTRGVYLYPGKFPDSFAEQCRRLYLQSVVLFSVGSLELGSLRPIVLEKGDLKTLQQLYSGISSEAKQLLSQLSEAATLNNQHKVRFASLFDRYLAALKSDIGLGSYFFPDETWGAKVLQDLRAIILL